jgi:hypothetical protein
VTSPDDPVNHQAVLPLEAAHGVFGPRAEQPVSTAGSVPEAVQIALEIADSR